MMRLSGGIRIPFSLGILAFSLMAGFTQANMGPLPVSLKGVPVPAVPGLLDGPDPIVVNKQKAIALGKALFWDVNVGSDGQACGSCHFHAGADRRSTNQVSPVGEAGDTGNGHVFEAGVDGNARGANYRLRRGDFPLNQMRQPLRDVEQDSFLRISDDVVGSGGTFSGQFRASELLDTVHDECARTPDDVFHVRGVGARRVTSRNAPTVINAVFNHRNFWDGRANNVFNGSSPWGDRDANAGIWVKQANGSVVKQRLRLVNSSLASQAVAPLTNTTEMACSGRRMADLGRKLQLRRPLEHQKVHWNDSVLGSYAYSRAGELKPGLKTYYFKLIREAFNAKYWSSTQRGPFGSPKPLGPEDRPLPYNQLEANFGLFFGLAVQLYESTLVSDDSPFDRSARDARGNPVELTPAQQRGMQVFRDAHCAICHVGPVFTPAAVHTNAEVAKSHPEAFGDSAFRVSASHNVVDRARGLKGNGFVDTGFVATGVTPAEWDRGLGGADAFGNPLSFAEQYTRHLAGNPEGVLDPEVSDTRACDLTLAIARNVNSPTYIFSPKDGVVPQPQGTEGCFIPQNAFLPTATAAARELSNPASRKMLTIVDGAYKVPSLRNVELTGPYMHNGGMATLEEVVEFYARGGNFETPSKQFGLVFPQPDLQLDADKRADLIEFLKSLTDDRVRYERAPFDHPEIAIPAGHAGDHIETAGGNALDAALAVDEYLVIPAVGAQGMDTPLKPFEEYLDD
jgi:cytochrome c peroxidase